MLWCLFVLLTSLIGAQIFEVDIISIHDEDTQDQATNAIEAAISEIQKKRNDFVVREAPALTCRDRDISEIPKQICDLLKQQADKERPPAVAIDTTRAGAVSEAVKEVLRNIGIPTISCPYGLPDDVPAWKNLSSKEKGYLIQVMPPGEIIPYIIRSLAETASLQSAAVFYDNNFILQHKYKSLLVNLPTRHLLSRVKPTIEAVRNRSAQLKEIDVANYFILGGIGFLESALVAAMLNKMYEKNYAWYLITKEEAEDIAIECDTTCDILYMKPKPQETEKLKALLNEYNGLRIQPLIDTMFYFDLTFRALEAIYELKKKNQLPVMSFPSCPASANERPDHQIPLADAFKEVDQEGIYGDFHFDENENIFQQFTLEITEMVKKTINNKDSAVVKKKLGSWTSGLPSGSFDLKDANFLKSFKPVTKYRIGVTVFPPFIYKNITSDGQANYSGYSIDMVRALAVMMNFDYDLVEYPIDTFPNIQESHLWNGIVGALGNRSVDIVVTPLAVMAERETRVDFTIPYYDLVGISIVMKKPVIPSSLFKFLTVLDTPVWGCILAAYFFTSILLWLFDRFSPFSYQNNKPKYEDDDEKREFTLRESLWFCMTSLTPQGGGEAPKNLSGRLMAATWWLFGFIIIASYTANLAAFLTVSRLESPITSLDDLAKQYKVRYAPVQGSISMTYFQRRAYIEEKFYEIWKDMSLNDSLSEDERARLAVWDYPISDKYTKIWQQMSDANLSATFKEGIERVRTEEFALIAEATEIKYAVMISCDLMQIGDEFSRKPYALAVQKGSPLKDQLSLAILKLQNQRKLETFKEDWWTLNPQRQSCEDSENQSDGISIKNIGGVFIVILIGIVMACMTLVFEYWWYRVYKRQSPVTQMQVMQSRSSSISNPLPPVPRLLTTTTDRRAKVSDHEYYFRS